MLEILCFVSKGFLNIPMNTDVCWLVVYTVQYLYTIEHAVENIAYFSFQSISVLIVLNFSFFTKKTCIMFVDFNPCSDLGAYLKKSYILLFREGGSPISPPVFKL